MNELNEAIGYKRDEGKLRWDLLPITEIEQVVKVLTFSLKKYPEGNWIEVKDSRKRYFAAACRHFFAWWRGEKLDGESHLPHLAHAICCLVFLLWFDNNAKVQTTINVRTLED